MNGTNINLEHYEALINNCDPIDTNDPAYEQIFRDLQGGVIKNYGRNYSLYIFIQFYENKQEEIKKWIRDDIACSVTSTWRQLKDTAIFKEIRAQDSNFLGKLCKNFFLSYQGYKRLGLNPDSNEGKTKIDSQFMGGMKQDWNESYRFDLPSTPPEDYWYNPPESWDIGKDQIDALILLAHDGLEALKEEAKTLLIEFGLEEIGQVVACEAGYALRDNDKTIGPFGFADGVSQPLFLKSDYVKYCQNHHIDLWDPRASLNLVLVKDPFGTEYSYGSYCVFKKLETNLELFEAKVEELATELQCDDREIAGALAIGRFKDGTPIALSDKPNQNDKNLPLDNNFNYADDFSGGKCPLQAHIRKVNPRKDDPGQENSRRKTNRIFRAGITYFEPPTEPRGLDVLQLCLNKLDYLGYITEVSKRSLADKTISGLLFVCFQKSISQQFSLLQQQWADDSEFPRERSNGQYKYLDPIIGHPAKRNRHEYPAPQEWPTEWNGNQVAPHPFYGCVRERGGEFFFAPSISFLKNL